MKELKAKLEDDTISQLEFLDGLEKITRKYSTQKVGIEKTK